jgi:hypothetical protein
MVGAVGRFRTTDPATKYLQNCSKHYQLLHAEVLQVLHSSAQLLGRLSGLKSSHHGNGWRARHADVKTKSTFLMGPIATCINVVMQRKWAMNDMAAAKLGDV